MLPTMDNPMCDPAKVDEFYTDEAPPLEGLVTILVKVPISVPVNANGTSSQRPSDVAIETEQDAIDHVSDDIREYVVHAIEKHRNSRKEGDLDYDFDPDVSGIEVIQDESKFEAA